MIPVSDETIEFVSYYENIMKKFYHEHYYILVISIVTLCMTVFLIFFAIAVRKADRELAEEKKEKEKKTATSNKGTKS